MALVGLALLVVQVVRTINGSALGTIGAVLLWLGVGLLALAIVFLTTTLLAPPPEPSSVDGDSVTQA
jgi:hypothetical protein